MTPTTNTINFTVNDRVRYINGTGIYVVLSVGQKNVTICSLYSFNNPTFMHSFEVSPDMISIDNN